LAVQSTKRLSTVDRSEFAGNGQEGDYLSFDLLANFVNPILVISPDKSIRFANPAFEELTGFTQEQVIGIKPPYPWWLKENYRSYRIILWNYMQRGVHQYEHVFQTIHGKKFWVAITLTPVEYQGKIRGHISNWVDITPQVLKNQRITKELYQRERKLRRDLEQEIARRGQFFRMLVHELKTPLTATLFSSELLCEEIEEEPYLSLAKNIKRAVSSLNSRIDDLMDLAKGEMGMVNLHLSRVDLLATIREVSEEISIAAMREGKSFVLDVPESLPLVRCDVSRIRQILQNLLNNALKYTEPGVVITLRAGTADKDVLIEVEDTGKGISRQKQCWLFTPYYRVIKNKDYHGGLGLGLALCKILVELHGGQIWVDSTTGNGAKFSFSLPLTPRAINNNQKTHSLL